MVLKSDVIQARLAKLEAIVSGLEELRTSGSESLRDVWAVERGLHLAAECLFDIGNHVLSAHFGIHAEDYEDILEQLGRRGVIGAALRDRFQGLGGFRNILVHQYLTIEPARVRELLERAPRDFSVFAAEIRGWLEEIATDATD